MSQWLFLQCKPAKEVEEPLEEHTFKELHERFNEKRPHQAESPKQEHAKKDIPKDTRPSWTTAPAFANSTWRASSIKMHNGTFAELLTGATTNTVDYWTVDPPFNVLKDAEDIINPATLDELVDLIDKFSTPTAVGDIYLSRDGPGTTYHDWLKRFKKSKNFEVKDKYYVRCTNKVGSRGVQLPTLSTVQEVLLFGPKSFTMKDMHINFEDPRVDWATNWMEEYV